MYEINSKNNLANETSPYLLQHADNPVEWYPWGEKALLKAKQENKLILLSIGYSSCHWCHVMAHESFEDEETAAIMNRYFVNIKVDREERPDIDKIYQTAFQMMNQRSGGWPLTAFLTPEQIPIFIGTYFPKEHKHQLPAFKDLLIYIDQVYQEQKDEIAKQNTAVLRALQNLHKGDSKTTEPMTIEILAKAKAELVEYFDKENGGFGTEPKFPQMPLFTFLFYYYFLNKDQEESQEAADIISFSLTKMGHSGLYDLLGGGFFRYAVDNEWQIPHFEKMLYDNGQILMSFAVLNTFHPNKIYQQVIKETGNWVIREMQSPQGYYYGSIDADSEGHEGKFYTWTRGEIESELAEKEWEVFFKLTNIHDNPNFEVKWHLHTVHSLETIAQQLNISHTEAQQLLNNAKLKLFQLRETRIKPHRDEKMLSAWNALMIKGMLIAGQYMQQEHFTESALKALNFICQEMWRDNRLFATYKDGVAKFNAYLDDYVFLIDAIITALSNRWSTYLLNFAIALADNLLNHFEDKEQGGFFFTSDEHEQLLYRPKHLADEAIPSGNGVAVYVLLRLGYLLGEPRFLQAAERTLQMAWPYMSKFPSAHGTLLIALGDYLAPPTNIILRGVGEELADWQNTYHEINPPRSYLFIIPHNEKDLPKALAEKSSSNHTMAYICQGLHCLAPIKTIAEFKNVLSTIK